MSVSKGSQSKLGTTTLETAAFWLSASPNSIGATTVAIMSGLVSDPVKFAISKAASVLMLQHIGDPMVVVKAVVAIASHESEETAEELKTVQALLADELNEFIRLANELRIARINQMNDVLGLAFNPDALQGKNNG